MRVLLALGACVVATGCAGRSLEATTDSEQRQPCQISDNRLFDTFDGSRIDPTCWTVVGNASTSPEGVLVDGRHGGPNLMESAVTAAGDFTLTARVRVVDHSGAPSLAFGWRDPDLALLVPISAPDRWHVLINGQAEELDHPVAVTANFADLEITRHGSTVEFWIDGSRVRVIEGRNDVYRRLRVSAMGAGALLADYVSLN
jgi:hypothetical protein